MFSRHTNLRLLIIASCRKANGEPFVKKFSIINRPHQLKHAFISNQKADLFQASNKGNHFYLMNQCNRIAKIAFKISLICSVNAKYLFVIPIGTMASNRDGKTVQQWVDDCITSQPVVVFSKTYCPFCDMAKVGI